jgi:hypothetical protein
MRRIWLALTLLLASCAPAPIFLPPKAEAPGAPEAAMQGDWFSEGRTYRFESSLGLVKFSATRHEAGSYLPEARYYEGRWQAGRLVLTENPHVLGTGSLGPGGWLLWDGARGWSGELDGQPLQLKRLPPPGRGSGPNP